MEAGLNFALLKFVHRILLTPRNRVLEKLIVAQLVKKFSAFYVTQRFITRSKHSSVVQCWATGWMIEGSNPGKDWEFLLNPVYRRALGPTQPHIQWAPGAPSPGVKRSGCEDHFHLVPRSRMRGAVPPLPQYTFMVWCSVNAWGQICHYL
jgi:hypothetical protein